MASAEGAWLAHVRGSARVVIGTVTYVRGGGNSGRGGRGGDSNVVTRLRQLVTSFRVCVEDVILCGGLTLDLVLPTRVTTAAVIVLVGFLV